MKYPIAETFKSLQGEGVYTGTPMAFIRLVGCSVGQKICTACDTDFDRVYPNLGGGHFTPEDLLEWVGPYKHVCVTGGEPLDRNLFDLFSVLDKARKVIHVETSGTKEHLSWLKREPDYGWTIIDPAGDGFPQTMNIQPWICVSPKPGWTEYWLAFADEIKVIYPGLGEGEGWPSLQDALNWARRKIVFLQPRNLKHDPDEARTLEVVRLVEENPTLRASIQLHKILNKR